MATKYPWVVLNGKLGLYECHRCGGTLPIPQLPQPVNIFVGICEVFIDHHKHCPEPKQPADAQEG